MEDKRKSTQKCLFTGKPSFLRYEIPSEIRGRTNWIRHVPIHNEYLEYLGERSFSKIDGELIQRFFEISSLQIQQGIIQDRINELKKKMEKLQISNNQRLAEFQKSKIKKEVEIEVSKDQHQEQLDQKEVMKQIIEEKKKKLDLWD